MRRVINLCVLIGVFMFSNLAMATEILSVKVTNSSTINVSLSNTRSGQKLFLKDYEGEILFDVTVGQAESYRKFFDFGQLKNGIYFVETETEFDIKVTPVLKNNKGVALISNSVMTIFKPSVKVEENNIVKIMVVNSKKEDVSISIQDEDGFELLSEDMDEAEFVLKRTYNFKNVPSGEYNIYIYVKDRSFAKKISI